MLTPLSEENKDALAKHHTHFLLFDIGVSETYLDDKPRSDFVKAACNNSKTSCKCYAVTIIVDGGCNTPETILNDLEAEHPVVIVYGSGRIANLLGMLLASTSNETDM